MQHNLAYSDKYKCRLRAKNYFKSFLEKARLSQGKVEIVDYIQLCIVYLNGVQESD